MLGFLARISSCFGLISATMVAITSLFTGCLCLSYDLDCLYVAVESYYRLRESQK
jgi:hypothetical protein